MGETRKLAAILVSDVVGYSRLTGADEDRILARLRALRSDLIDPTIAVHHGRVVKRIGDGAIVEFRSVVDAVNCSIEVQRAMVERNAGVAPDKRIEFRIGIHLGDVVEESDGDLMGDGVNIAARLEGIAKPGAICMSEDAYRQVKGRLDLAVHDLGLKQLKNIAEPIRVYSLDVAQPARAKPAPAQAPEKSAPPRLSIVLLPFANIGGDPEQEHFVDGVTESLTTDLSRIRGAYVVARNTAFTYKGKPLDVKAIGRELNVRYVLKGSVQRGGSRMRVNVQLIDAETGNHLWAERFDKALADLFDMQDEIVARLANALNAQLAAAEARRAAQAPNPDSMDLYFQGLACYNRGRTPDNAPCGRQVDRGRVVSGAPTGGERLHSLRKSPGRTPATANNTGTCGNAHLDDAGVFDPAGLQVDRLNLVVRDVRVARRISEPNFGASSFSPMISLISFAVAQPDAGARPSPVGAQNREEPRRQHGVALPAALAALDMNEHARTVDRGDLQSRDLADAQPGHVRRRQRDAVAQSRHRRKQARDLLGGEDRRQLLRRAAVDDPLRRLRPAERDAKEEPQSAGDLVDVRPGIAFGDEMQLVGADVLHAEPVRRTMEMSAEPRDRIEVGLLSCRREVADRHVLDHPQAKRARRSHVGLLSPRGGMRRSTSSQTGPLVLTRETSAQQPRRRSRAAGSFNPQLSRHADAHSVGSNQ